MVLLFCTLVLFGVLTFGVGPLLAPASDHDPIRRVAIGIAASLVLTFLAGFTLYVFDLPQWVVFAAALGGAMAMLWRQATLTKLWSSAELRRVTLLWLAVAAWLLGWELCIVNFSGGGWAGDWAEHYERAVFFAEHWPLDHLFIYRYPLAARPPLLNVVTSSYFAITGVNFGVFQALMVLTASLVFWPLFLLQRSFAPAGSPSANPAWIAGLLMTLPSFVQQSTFLWTKVQTAMFILLALALLRTMDESRRRRRLVLLALSAAALCHFSAGPWIVALGIAWFVAEPERLKRIKFRELIGDSLPAAVLALTWFGWSSLQLGLVKTFGSNTSLSPGMDMTWTQRLEFMATNFRTTLTPPPLRGDDWGTVFANEPVARVRDSFFLLLQSNLPLFAGTMGFAIALWLLVRARAELSSATRRFWTTLLVVVVALGICTHSTPNPDGVANISLFPLALLAIAWIAARVPAQPDLRRLLFAGLTFDFLFGIVLHFGLQSLLLPRWIYPDLTQTELIQIVGQPAGVNLQYANLFGTRFLGGEPGALIVAITLLSFAALLLIRGARSIKVTPLAP